MDTPSPWFTASRRCLGREQPSSAISRICQGACHAARQRHLPRSLRQRVTCSLLVPFLILSPAPRPPTSDLVRRGHRPCKPNRHGTLKLQERRYCHRVHLRHRTNLQTWLVAMPIRGLRRHTPDNSCWCRRHRRTSLHVVHPTAEHTVTRFNDGT
jgi:hypothetical protein